MTKTFASLLVLLSTVPAAAQTTKPATPVALAKAEQSVVMATCKLDWLKTHGAAPRTQPVYFAFMAECLSKTASN